MKIVGQMALAGFPMWEMCLSELSKHCDEIYLRCDENRVDKSIKAEEYNKICNGKLKSIFCTHEPFHKWKWREDMIRMLDDVKPDIVISLDEDEIFDDTINEEIKDFEKSDKLAMMVNYNPMPTENNEKILKNLPYPILPHMKIFKWKSGLTYKGYHGNALVPEYNKREFWWNARSKINHYCFYKKEWLPKKIEDMRKYSVPMYFKRYYGVELVPGMDT
jgi:hypothetical protein